MHNSSLPPRSHPKLPLIFWEWLGGVVDGDGHFRLVHKGGRQGEMTLEMGVVDEALLRYIQTSLGYGSTQKMKGAKGKGTLRLVISRGADFDHLAAHVGGHIHHQGRRAQLAAVLQERGQPLPPRKLR